MIERLSDSQIAKIPDYVREWTAIGLSTDPADRPRAEAAIQWMYSQANLGEPRIVWCGSPLSQGLARSVLQRASVGASVLELVGTSVLASVGASVLASVGASVLELVGDSVRDSVGDSIGASVRELVGDSVRASVGDSVRASVRDSAYGQHDAGWLSYFRFFRDECGLISETDPLHGMWELCQSAGWALPHRGICWVSERHNILRRNDAGRLHCEDGPAVAYPDGWNLWRVHGVAVDEQTVLRPELQTVAEIDGDANVERRRVRIERFGWERYLRESVAEARDSRRNERDCQTEELFWLKDGTQRFLCVDPSTGRKYALGVPAEIETCDAAQNWMSHGLDRLAVHRS